MITPRFKRLSASTTLSLPVTTSLAFSPLSAGEGTSNGQTSAPAYPLHWFYTARWQAHPNHLKGLPGSMTRSNTGRVLARVNRSRHHDVIMHTLVHSQKHCRWCTGSQNNSVKEYEIWNQMNPNTECGEYPSKSTHYCTVMFLMSCNLQSSSKQLHLVLRAVVQQRTYQWLFRQALGGIRGLPQKDAPGSVKYLPPLPR